MKKIFTNFGILFAVVLLSCKGNYQFQLPDPDNTTTRFAEDSIFQKGNAGAPTTNITGNGTYTFVVRAAYPAAADESLSLEPADDLSLVVAKYNTFKEAKDYVLLPADHYSVNGSVLKKGSTSAEIVVDIKRYDTLPQNNYILPLKLKIEGRDILHLIFLRKDAAYVSITATNKKPMPPGTYNCPDRKEPMKMVAYVETNDYDIRNMGQFILKESKKPVFDIVVLFAANMNYDARLGKRVLHFNDKLQPILKDPEKYIKPLTDRGIKVLIDILPNHQGVGYANFQNYQEALEFAKECKKYTDMLGIDGWDIDEEYANYSVLPSKPVVGLKSYFWFMKAMKEVMPDKLLTLYDYAHPINSASIDEDGKTASDYLDYSWANYGENHGSYAGLPTSRYGKQSVEANWGLGSAEYYASSNLQGCFGLFMFFNIRGSDIRSGTDGVDLRNGYASKQLSKATKLFYGEDCEFVGKYHYGPKGN